MVHAAILCARSGTATLKEIYAACIRFGRVRCRRTGGWRLVTERRNWKSHVRHTLYTTEKFLRCPHDSDSWMIAPEFCYAIPQTTRQLTGNAVQEDDAEAAARGSSARSRTKAAQHTQYASLSAYQKELRGDRQVTGKVTSARQNPVAGRGQHSATGASTDRNDHTARDGEEWSGGELQDDQKAEEADQRLQFTAPSLEEDRAPGTAISGGTLAATTRAYVVGSLAGRTQALLGVTAAAAAALGDEELDFNDAGTRAALRAAQEVLNNPAAAKILLRLMQQRQVHEQQQLQELLQQHNQHGHVAGLQDRGTACRAHRKRRMEESFEEDGEGGLAATPAVKDDEQDEGMPGRRAAPERVKRDRQAEKSDGRQARASEAMPHSRSTAHMQQSPRTSPQTQSGSKGSGCSERRGETSFREPVMGDGGCAEGTFVTDSEVRLRIAGRLDGSNNGGGCGADRRWAIPRTSQYVDAPWHEDEDTEADSWEEHPDVDDDEEWDVGEDAMQCHHCGGVSLRLSPRENSPGLGDKAPTVAPAADAAALGWHEGSSPRQTGRFLTPAEQLSFKQSTAHLNVANTAATAAAAAAVAVATAAGDAPMLQGGPSDTALGAQCGWSGRNGTGPRADAAGDARTEAPRLKRARDASYITAPLALQNLAEELQVYHSRSTAAAAAMASSTNMQQPRGYSGHIAC
ncbi:hypothetical protein Vretimale_17929 [Volvox reticuliferus]|uniref:Fork-head domain-containing protein n=1 Tax=Volvox reticuliferus TaxID=1737510 RepID=A0A8J4CUA4_9CHLO|nr:hypothetical protein Vretifemale_17683 [Volvox reticuliferus]GIM15118.1 hypothetical protein Vretimale_17929 [Volvox reticuliferus]